MAKIPKLTPDGAPRQQRRAGDQTERSTVDQGDDPEIAGDVGEGAYANTDEATPNEDGLVRQGDGRDQPLI